MLFQALVGIQAYRGRNKIISAVDKYYFIRSVPKHFHFSYYGMRAEAIFWTFNKYISFTLNAWKVQLPCPLPVCQVSHKKLKKEFCGFMFLSNSLFWKQHWILVYKLKNNLKKITDIIFYNHHCHHQFVRSTRIKKICKPEVHTILAMNRNAVKNKGFQKWNSEILEEVKVFPIGKERFAVWKHK